jgi:hypothetical protein
VIEKVYQDSEGYKEEKKEEKREKRKKKTKESLKERMMKKKEGTNTITTHTYPPPLQTFYKGS